MKIEYFLETDTLYIELRSTNIAETQDVDENTLLEIASDGEICTITLEHASDRTDTPDFSFERV